eukprot:CAMPEP_0206332764 /NCGR_PEP_ID=MMETSP0106_2-20121207/24934_1 /ASSEMBLY_ACC=CAM_ASM_000206 /TAXON_ID=81532 /ORGANISM="Acanthoeca-like sp., Strain 10tr" /LENGTH=32 /DNA_ID= /DNA_START= /DNA_END= /DNA_ORIENTATION=
MTVVNRDACQRRQSHVPQNHGVRRRPGANALC